MGKKKVLLRDGVMGKMEEISEESMEKIMKWLKEWIRG